MEFQSPTQAELVKHSVYREIYRLRCMISGLSEEASDRERLEPQIEQLEAFYERLSQ